MPKIPALLIVTLYAVWQYRRSGYRAEPTEKPLLVTFFGGFIISSMIVLFFIWLLDPIHLLEFPRKQPIIWVMVVFLYPFLSALPQEFIYRKFYFSRYSPIFKSKQVLFWSSVCNFTFLHLIYDNIPAVILSALGGVFFTYTWKQTRSLYWTSLQHALFGILIFTSGLGRFFYEPFQ